MQLGRLRLWRPFRVIRFRYLAALATLALIGPPVGIAARCALAPVEPIEAGPQDPPAVRRAKEHISSYQRSGASTYLTMPGWFIVFATDEYAAALAADRPSRFPYFNAVGQYWISYHAMCRPACGSYPFDAGDHLMLAVAGVGYTIDNTVKGVYENTIGRATEALATTDTDEDRFAAATATAYGRFMHMTPWYDFSFRRRLSLLWSQVPMLGPHPLRKWERRLALTVEYSLKTIYGWAIRRVVKAFSSDEDEWIYAWADRVPDATLRDPRLRRVTAFGRGSYILALRRHELFTGVVPQLAAAGVHFNDIAGSRRILITAVCDREHTPSDDPDAHLLFIKRLLTSTAQQRVGIDTNVEKLGEALKRLADAGAVLEHIYDF